MALSSVAPALRLTISMVSYRLIAANSPVTTIGERRLGKRRRVANEPIFAMLERRGLAERASSRGA